MKKEDWSAVAVIMEAVDLMIGFFYIGLQVYYGYLYHVKVYQVLLNVLVGILIYIGMTLLALYPERMNRLSPEVCQGKVRKYSLQMVRVEKFLFLLTLLIPCICDVIAIDLPAVYSVIAIFAMLIIAVSYEIMILRALRERGE